MKIGKIRYLRYLEGCMQRMNMAEEQEQDWPRVKRVIDDHKGEIRIESELGQGSTFYLSFPKVSKIPEVK